MYRILKAQYELRGWSLLPYAVADRDAHRVFFVDRKTFDALELCDGRTDLSLPVVPQYIRDPAAALEQANAQLSEENESMMFVTVWLAVLEISTGRGLACNAGHENPAVRRAGGEYELLAYPHQLFMGAVQGARYRNREFELHPGDCVFVYTDGVPEAVDTANEMFGEERLADTLNQCPDADPETLVRHVYDAVIQFAGGAERYDDITMLSFRYDGAQGGSGARAEGEGPGERPEDPDGNSAPLSK